MITGRRLCRASTKRALRPTGESSTPQMECTVCNKDPVSKAALPEFL